MRRSNLPTTRIFQQSVTAGGTAEKLTVKIRATTLAFNNKSSTSEKDTITDSGNAFLTAGFKAGDSITVSGATNTGNNDTFEVSAVAAGTLTLTESGILTTEAAGATAKIVAPVAVPEGVAVTIKAKYGNSGTIFVGHSAASAKSTGFTLRNNESLNLQVSRTDQIWIDGTTGEGVEVILETNLNAGE